jgi:hypothetical protein
MAEDKIDSYVDRSGVKGDTDFIVASLQQVYAEFKKLEGVKVDLRGAAGLSGLGPVMQAAKVGADSLAIATAEVTKRIASLNGKSKEFTDLLIKQARAQTEAAKTATQEAKAATESAKAKAANAKASAEEAKAAREATKAKDLEEKLTRNLLKAKEDINKAAIKEAELAGKLSNEYEQLKAKYTIAANTAKQLAAANGLNNAETQEAIAVAARYNDQLLKIEKAVGQSQRNVGNYTQATFALTQVLREAPAFANSFATGISAISNNIPMLIDQIKILQQQNVELRAQGLKTIPVFGLFAKSLLSLNSILPIAFLLLQTFAGSLFGAGKAAKEFVKDVEDIKQGIEEANDRLERFNKELDTLQKFGEITVDINFGDDFEREALKARQASVRMDEELDKTEGKVNDLKDAYNKLTDQIFLSGKVSTKTLDAIKDYSAKNIPDNLISDLRKRDQKIIGAYKELGQALAKSEDELNDARDKRDLARAKIRLLNVEHQRELDKEAAEKAKKDAEKAEKERLELLERNRKAQFEIIKLNLQLEIDANKEVAENEKISNSEREEALRIAQRAKVNLINATADYEIKAGKKTKKELELIEEQRQDALIRAANEFGKERVAIWQKMTDEIREIEKQLNRDLPKTVQAGIESIQKKIDDRIEAERKAGEQLKKIENDVKEFRISLYKDFADEITQTIAAVFEAEDDRKLAALQAEIDALERKKQKDIEVVNQTVTNRQQAAAEITIIEARAQAEREQIAIRQRKIEKDKQNIDRLSQIGKIGGDLASGIFNLNLKAAEIRAEAALLAANPLTAAFAPYALAQSAIVQGQIPFLIAVSAAQLARLALPKYKHGKNVHDDYEGPAIVGDGGKKEAIIREDGTVQITADTPQVTHVSKKDVILPDANMLINYVLAGHMGGRLSTALPAEQDHVTAEIKAMKNAVVSAIKKIPQPQIKVMGMIERRIRYNDNSNEYLNNNLQG